MVKEKRGKKKRRKSKALHEYHEYESFYIMRMFDVSPLIALTIGTCRTTIGAYRTTIP